jgi:hypothetical protein
MDEDQLRAELVKRNEEILCYREALARIVAAPGRATWLARMALENLDRDRVNWKEERALAKQSWPNMARQCPEMWRGSVRCEHLIAHPSGVKHMARVKTTGPQDVGRLPFALYVEW